MRPDARPQARKNQRCIRWNTLRIFSGRARFRWSWIVRRSRTVNGGQASRAASFDPAKMRQEQVDVLNATVRFGLEGYAHQVSHSLASALTQTRIPLKSLTVQDRLSRINMEGLTASFTQSMSGRLAVLGLRLIQTRVTFLRLTLQLWDTRTGEIISESSGEATLAAEDVRESRIPFDDIARRLWSHMLDDLFTGLTVQ